MKLFLSIVLGVLAALFAAVLVAALTSGPDGASAISLGGAEVPVAVAVHEMDAGQKIQAEDIKEVQVSRQRALNLGLVGSESAVGRVLVRPISPGQGVTTSALAGSGTGPEIEAMLEGGYRATTVTLTDRGPGTFVYPGSFVDVIAIFRMPAGTPNEGERVSRTVLEGVQVLAVEGYSNAAKLLAQKNGAKPPRGSSRGTMITLLLTPTQSQVLQLAQDLGTISVTLRSNEDDRRVPATTVTLKQMLAYQPVKPQSAAVKKASSEPVAVAQNDEVKGKGVDEKVEPEVVAAEAPQEEVLQEQVEQRAGPWRTIVIRNGNRSTYQFEEQE